MDGVLQTWHLSSLVYLNTMNTRTNVILQRTWWCPVGGYNRQTLMLIVVIRHFEYFQLVIVKKKRILLLIVVICESHAHRQEYTVSERPRSNYRMNAFRCLLRRARSIINLVRLNIKCSHEWTSERACLRPFPAQYSGTLRLELEERGTR